MSLFSFLGLRAADFQSVDVPTFAKQLQQENTFLLDVRTEKEYAEGHLKGSVCIDVTQADFLAKAEKQLPKDKTIALYCRSGRRSKKAAGLLADAGYKEARMIERGSMRKVVYGRYATSSDANEALHELRKENDAFAEAWISNI